LSKIITSTFRAHVLIPGSFFFSHSMINMTSPNIIGSLIGLSILALAVRRFAELSHIKESFAGGLPAFTVKAQRVVQMGNKDGFVEVPGNYQSMLSPRFSNVDYGAHIRYNMPSKQHQAVNVSNPLTYGSILNGAPTQGQTVEGYQHNAGAPGCRVGGGGSPLNVQAQKQQQHPTMNSFQQQQNQLQYTDVTDLLPVPAEGQAQVLNALGQTSVQPVVYDRMIYANQKSRLYSQGDPIRGDLPIVPVRTEWFRPSVHPQIDLRNGALMAMGGPDNSTTKQLLALQTAATGGLQQVGSGVNYAVQKSMFSSAAGGDVQVTAFP